MAAIRYSGTANTISIQSDIHTIKILIISDFSLIALSFHNFSVFTRERKQKVPFSTVIENDKLTGESCPQHMRKGAARIK